jgi:hypothetical protein
MLKRIAKRKRKDVVINSVLQPRIVNHRKPTPKLIRGKTTVNKKTTSMPDHIKKYAQMADQVYKPRGKRSLTNSDGSSSKAPKLARNNQGVPVAVYQDGGWRYDSSLSSNHIGVYVNDTDKKVVSAFRGTDLSHAGDLVADAAIASGTFKISHRFNRMSKAWEKVYGKYSDYEHIVTGHSLGGTTALALHDKYKDKISESHAFNPGSGLDVIDPMRDMLNESNPDKHAHFIRGDIISNGGINSNAYTSHVYEKTNENENVHSVQQFIT